MVLCERFLLTVPDCVCAGPLMSCVAVLFCSFFVYLYIVAFPPLIIRKCANVKNALNENTTDKNISFSFLDNASVFSFCHLAYSACSYLTDYTKKKNSTCLRHNLLLAFDSRFIFCFRFCFSYFIRFMTNLCAMRWFHIRIWFYHSFNKFLHALCVIR